MRPQGCARPPLTNLAGARIDLEDLAREHGCQLLLVGGILICRGGQTVDKDERGADSYSEVEG